MLKKAGSYIALAVLAVFVLGGTTTKASATYQDRHMRIMNRASSTVDHLYISNAAEEEWGPDQLGNDQFIAPDHYRDFNVDDGTDHCLYDFKAILHDSREVETHKVNVCKADTWTISDAK
jgi:hypothetical protein